MARMFPDNIHIYNPTASERYIYDLLKNKLPDSYYVFYSVKWYYEENGIRVNSECDFIIFNPQYGYLTLEIKGGVGIQRNGQDWILYLSKQETRKLKRSPFEQAESSMRYFYNYYRDYYNQYYSGIYGYAVVFPFFVVNNDLGTDSPKALIIDKVDLNNLENRIKELFHYWKGKRRYFNNLTESQRKKFINLINKRIALSAAAGALIEIKNAQLELINRVQDNYLYLIRNYNKAFITGGAGTGKTWLAIKKSKYEAQSLKKVLLVCSSLHLRNFFSNILANYKNIHCKTFYEIVKDIVSEEEFDLLNKAKDLAGVYDIISNYSLEQYDSIIIDEGQDFTEEWATVINLMLKDSDNGVLYVFYDSYQNVYHRDFKEKFNINNPPFILRENIRNTSNIYTYAVKATNLGKEVHPNTIEGSDPEVVKVVNFKGLRQKIEEILNTLIIKEKVSSSSIVIISDYPISKVFKNLNEIGRWNITNKKKGFKENEIPFYEIADFKGLESDVIIFINHNTCSPEELYVAYTRARYYLYEINVV